MRSRLTTTRVIVLCVAGALIAFGCWFFGVDAWYAAGFALVFVALGIAWACLGGAEVPDWSEDDADAPAGMRDDVVRLAWSLRTHKGQVREPAYKRMRQIARVRLAPHQLDIDDPGDQPAIEDMIGAWAYRALHTPGGRLPSLAAVENCLTALDDLVADPGPSRNHALPEPVHNAFAGTLKARPLAALLRRRSSAHDR